MSDNFNPNGSGAQEALREDRAADAAVNSIKDSIKDKVKGKAQQKGSDFLKNKLGKKEPDLGDLSNGMGGAENAGSDAAADAAGESVGQLGKKSLLGGKKPDAGGGIKNPVGKAINAGQVASASGKVGLLAKLIGFMKMAMGIMQQGVAAVVGAVPAFLAAIGNAIAGAANAVAGFLASIGSAVVSGVSAFAAGIAGALGVGSTAATVTAVSAAGLAGVSSVALVGGVIMSVTNQKYDGNVPDCAASVKQAKAVVGEVAADAAMLENAKKIYSVMKTFGLSDEQVAGILGNWQIESGVDPTTIEGIYDEHQNIQGPKHQNAMKDWDAYVRGPLSAAYAGGTDYTQNSGYMASDGKKYPGIGLVQWTGGGAMLFLNFAESIQKDWWSVDYQLAYVIAKGAPTGQFGKQFWSTYKSQSGSAGENATWFAQYFEGNTKLAGAARSEAAEEWLKQEKSWSIDTMYGNSIIDMAKQLGDVATDGAVANKLKSCVRAQDYDNSTLAKAAVSYAYETKDEGKGNDGTPLYRRVHEVVWPGDPNFQSCDRGVSTAVKWSGTDDDYPAGGSDAQLAYLNTSDKWTKVGSSGSVKMEDLMPGDVFCLNGHTFLYVGHDAVAAKYPNTGPKIDSVSASLNQRSPGCGNDANDIIERMHGQDWSHRGEYQIFRCSKPDGSQTYKDAGAGVD